MRVFNRVEFLRLPAGVVYVKGEPWAFESMAIKGDTIRHGSGDDVGDFGCLYFAMGVEAGDSGEEMNRLDEMLENGASYPMNESYGRDGCFDSKECFLVFEPADLQKLIGMFNEAIALGV